MDDVLELHKLLKYHQTSHIQVSHETGSRIISFFDNLSNIQCNIDAGIIIETVQLFLTVDDLFKSGIVDGQIHLDAWKRYIVVIRQHHHILPAETVELLSSKVNGCIQDGIESIFFQDQNFDASVLVSKCKLLFFFCQRISVTLAYLMRKLSPSQIKESILSLASFRGVLFIKHLEDNNQLSAYNVKCEELLIKALKYYSVDTSNNSTPTSSLSTTNTQENSQESTSCLILTHKRIVYRNILFQIISSSFTDDATSSLLSHLPKNNTSSVSEQSSSKIQNFTSFTILGLAYLSISDLSNIQVLIQQQQINNIMTLPFEGICRRCNSCIEEILACLECLTTSYFGKIEDKYIIILVERLGAIISNILSLLPSPHIEDLLGSILSNCISNTRQNCPFSVYTRLVLGNILSGNMSTQVLIIDTIIKLSDQMFISSNNLSNLNNISPIGFAETIRIVLLVSDCNNSITLLEYIVTLIRNISVNVSSVSTSSTNQLQHIIKEMFLEKVLKRIPFESLIIKLPIQQKHPNEIQTLCQFLVQQVMEVLVDSSKDTVASGSRNSTSTGRSMSIGAAIALVNAGLVIAAARNGLLAVTGAYRDCTLYNILVRICRYLQGVYKNSKVSNRSLFGRPELLLTALPEVLSAYLAWYRTFQTTVSNTECGPIETLVMNLLHTVQQIASATAGSKQSIGEAETKTIPSIIDKISKLCETIRLTVTLTIYAKIFTSQIFDSVREAVECIRVAIIPLKSGQIMSTFLSTVEDVGKLIGTNCAVLKPRLPSLVAPDMLPLVQGRNKRQTLACISHDNRYAIVPLSHGKFEEVSRKLCHHHFFCSIPVTAVDSRHIMSHHQSSSYETIAMVTNCTSTPVVLRSYNSFSQNEYNNDRNFSPDGLQVAPTFDSSSDFVNSTPELSTSNMPILQLHTEDSICNIRLTASVGVGSRLCNNYVIPSAVCKSTSKGMGTSIYHECNFSSNGLENSFVHNSHFYSLLNITRNGWLSIGNHDDVTIYKIWY